MKHFDPTQLATIETYKLLTGTVVPRPIALVISQSDTGVINLAPFSYFNVVAASPPTVIISVNRRDGEMKDTAANILSQKQFVIQLVDESNVDDVNETAVSFSQEQSEMEVTNFSLTESQKVAIAGIEQSKVRFEVVLTQHIPLSYNDEITTDVIMGEIVMISIDESIVNERFYIDMDKYKPIGRLSGNRYVKIGEIFELKRP